jgi:methyl-accepting chemotaxis protein
MQWFKNLSIRTKIGGVFGLTLVLALLMSSLIFMLVSMSQLATVAISENDNLMLSAKDVRIAVQYFQLHKNPDVVSRIDEAVNYYHKNADSLMKKLKLEESRRDLTKGVELMDQSAELAKRFIASGGDEAAQPDLYKTYVEKSEELFKLGEYARTEHPKKLFRIFNTIKTGVFAVNFFILLVGLLIGIMVARSISSDMRRSVEFVTAVADGDLTATIEINKKDEIGRLGGAMQEMARSLDQIVQRVRNNASEVATGSREIQASSESVAQSATEQAASVEEIAATIEEMMSSIKASAVSAQEGRQKATGAIELVNENVELSRQMAQAMEEITNAATHIREITDTVNQVAFQTNLLALNAAVEAARAGEHGKGFAVVAEEVRALAQRSADASREIKALIETTVNKVNAGSQLVTKVAGAMEEINVTTLALSQSMEEIAMAASEQSAGIEELNRAVSQVDQTTQSNAAVVEELAGNASSMLGTSDEMLDAVSMFRTSG